MRLKNLGWACEGRDQSIVNAVISHREDAAVVETLDRGKHEGKVKWFSDPKGYGFIVLDGATDIFVHHSAIQMEGFRTLKEGEIVIYDLLESPKGLQAANVTRVDPV